MNLKDQKIRIQKLDNSIDKFLFIIENINDMVAILDSKLVYEYINEAATRKLMGYSKEDMIGKCAKDFIHPEDQMQAIKIWSEGLKAGEGMHTLRVKHKEGHWVWLEIRGKTYIDKNGELKGVIISRDVTERKKTEEKLKESEEKYRDLFENAIYSRIIMNMDGIIIDCNSTTEKTFDYKKKDLINKKIEQILVFPPESLLKLMDIYKSILSGKNQNNIELKVLKKNGNIIWVNLHLSIIKLGNRDFINVILEDITARKLAEKKISQLEKTVEEVNALVESFPIAIFLLNQDCKILRVNDLAEDLFGYDKEDLRHKTIYDLINPEFLEVVKKHYKSDIFDLTASNKIETVVKAKTGKIIEVELASSILKIENDLIIQSAFINISERKNFEKNRELLLDQLQTALEFKSKFFANLSHEIRTPLNSILGFTQLLLEPAYGAINEPQKDFLNDIYSAGNHLLKLINTILDLSKIEAGKLELSLEKFNLKNVIEEVNSIIKPLYMKKGLEYIIDYNTENCLLCADPLRVKQILFNLLSNAIKFTEKGSFKLEVFQKSNYWEFQVSDTGIGIRKEDFNIIFREFGTIEHDLTKKVQGVGLGLALIKRLIQLHGGDIWFESEVGKGTTFYFTLPNNLKKEESEN